MQKIVIPWFEKGCSPNYSNNNWRIKYNARQKQKQIVRALVSGLPAMTDFKDNVPITIIFYTKRFNKDLDNCLSSIKAALDVIAEKIGVNDKQFRPITLDLARAEKTEQIEIFLDYNGGYYDEIPCAIQSKR